MILMKQVICVEASFFSLSFTYLYIFHVLQLYCPNGTSPIRNSGCFPRGKPAATESCYPTYGACWVFLCFNNPPNSDMNHRIFNMHTDVNASDCAWGCTDTVRESALRKIPRRTGESNLRRQRAGPMLYQLSYIPTPTLFMTYSCTLFSSYSTFFLR